MKISDYIVNFLIKNNITDVFGYPGGTITELMESFSNNSKQISFHLNYHEQASAFAACGYSQVTKKPGVAIATSGPGATNLITGICNAYFDSLPTIFITGQVNSQDCKKNIGIRQKGFQETDIVSMVKSVTKYAIKVENPADIKYVFEKAIHTSLEGRPGPVLIDIPMDFLKVEVEPQELEAFKILDDKFTIDNFEEALLKINMAKRPCLLIGAGIKNAGMVKELRTFVDKINIPVVTSMLAVDVLPREHKLNFGFIGAYGSRYSNFVVAKSDLIISLGSRLDIRQIGGKKENFAKEAILIRVDIDSEELSDKIKEDEIQINTNMKDAIDQLDKGIDAHNGKYGDWIKICEEIKGKLKNMDEENPNLIIKKISEVCSGSEIITTDVGQNQVWVAQSFNVKDEQMILFSGGHGAMGYSLPAAIGAYYGLRKPVISFNGDGGIQMNIQELQFIARERIPIKVIIMNNYSLGMIRHFQEMYFASNYTLTIDGSGYLAPNFELLAKAYGLEYDSVSSLEEINTDMFFREGPAIIEIKIKEPTYVYPKLEYGKENQDQDPLIDRELYNYLMNL